MTKRIICIFLALVLCMSGCVYRSVGDDTAGPAVYRISTLPNGSRLVRESVKTDGEYITVGKIVERLNAPAEDPICLRAFPSGVEIVGLSVEKGIAYVEMNPAYLELEGVDKLLADAAVVLSLSGIDEVCWVEIGCNGQALTHRLAVENYAQEDGLCGSFVRTLKLYLPNAAYTDLVPKSISINDDGSLSYAHRVLSELLPALGEDMAATGILSVKTEDGICNVELSEEFYGAEPTDRFEGMMLIYSIVNSLCRIPEIDGVVISVEGYTVESYGGFNTIWPLRANMSLVSYE